MSCLLGFLNLALCDLSKDLTSVVTFLLVLVLMISCLLFVELVDTPLMNSGLLHKVLNAPQLLYLSDLLNLIVGFDVLLDNLHSYFLLTLVLSLDNCRAMPELLLNPFKLVQIIKLLGSRRTGNDRPGSWLLKRLKLLLAVNLFSLSLELLSSDHLLQISEVLLLAHVVLMFVVSSGAH